MKQEPAIAIVVLAAGASERMGSPKQLLPWGETTLLGHCISQSLAAVPDVFVVLGAYYEQIKKEAARYPVTVLRNEGWAEGMGSSVAFAARHLLGESKKLDGILITLADQPLFDADYYHSVIGRFEAGNQNIVATSYNGSPGVPALFDDSYLEELTRLNGDTGAKTLMAAHREMVTIVDAGGRTVDIDTPETYRELYQKRIDE